MFEKQVSSSGDINMDPESEEEAEPEEVVTPISNVNQDQKEEASQEQ